MKPVPDTKAPQNFTDRELRGGIPVADRCHICTSAEWSDAVHVVVLPL